MIGLIILGASLLGITLIRYFLYQCDTTNIEYTPFDNGNVETVNDNVEVPPKYSDINLVN